MLNYKAIMRPVKSLLIAAPFATAWLSFRSTSCHLQASSTTLPTTTRLFSTSSSDGVSTAVSSLPRLLDTEGKELSAEQSSELLSGKRVAYYFAAGWCPMCTSFEPSLIQFRQAAHDSGKEIELIYVPSDRSAEAALKRSKGYQMLSVPFDDVADDLKKQYNIWAGSESLKFGFGRRSGVPALVVLEGQEGSEMAFVPAEARGIKALKEWPLDNDKGVW